MENENEVVVPNTTEEVAPEATENTEETVEETIDWEARAKKAEELASNQRIRAEKAEKKAKESVPTETKAGDLSSKDIIAINRANIHEDDLDEVVDYAKYKKISIAEALKTGVVSTLLKDRAEQRKTAQASNTGTARRSSTKVSDEEIVANAEKDQVPEDPEVLAKARWNLKKKRLEK